jgi:hypothetical protein
MIYNSDGSVSGSSTSIQYIHDNLAADGDTITIPDGPHTWTPSGPAISKAITLQGLGTVTTASTAKATNFATNCGTVITDACTGQNGLLQFTLVANKASRMTGIKFTGIRSEPQSNGIIYLVGGVYEPETDTRSMRIDHCVVNNLNGCMISTQDVMGVVDHCSFRSADGLSSIPFRVFNANWPGPHPEIYWALASGSWSDHNFFGTRKFLFFEDNNFLAVAPYAAVDSWGGARFVFRHNTNTNTQIELHGTESSGRTRGGRAVEVYANEFVNSPPAGYVVNLRSGVALIYDNTTSGSWANPPNIALHAHRMFYPLSPFGDTNGPEADGQNPWDLNATESDGTYVAAHKASPYLFGTFTATSGGTNPGFYNEPTVTVSGAGWTTNQWVGYSIRKTESIGIGAYQYASEIVANTSDTITYYDAGGYGTTMTFMNGDVFTIRKVIHPLDGVGRSEGTPIAGTDTPILPTGWNDQIDSPCYEWNNKNPDGTTFFHMGSATATAVLGTNYINDTGSHTPAPGYTPYTYPHPLVSGSVSGDIIPPVVTLDSPTGTVSGIITLSATATDDVDMSGVQFRRDGVNNIGAEVTGAGPTFTRTFDTTTISNGPHTFNCLARDTATPGNTTVSNVLTLNVANTVAPPTAAITAPSNGATVSGTISVKADASDAVAVLGVTFKRDGGTVIGSEDTVAPYAVSLDTTLLADGTHTLVATARNASLTTNSATVTVTVANGSPPAQGGGAGKKKKKKMIGRRH